MNFDVCTVLYLSIFRNYFFPAALVGQQFAAVSLTVGWGKRRN